MNEKNSRAVLQRMQTAADRVRTIDRDYKGQLMRAMRQRDEAIVAAARAGTSIAEIAEATELSRVRAKQIIVEDKWR